ncbi:MAG TPA: CBS domain-containing protein [Stellaceae bacterium]|nr:CBS domain-containing protein [Stellaceae bacterium]
MAALPIARSCGSVPSGSKRCVRKKADKRGRAPSASPLDSVIAEEKAMNAADVMTLDPLSVTPHTALVEAARLMLQHRISGLPVTDAKGAVVGVLTEGDLLRRVETGTERHRTDWLAFLMGPGRLAGEYVDAHARKVGEVMTHDVVVVGASTDLAEIVQLMEKHRIKRVPVLADGKLVGIVSRSDLVRALVHKLTREAVARAGNSVSDDTIRDHIVEIIDKEPWGPRFSANVTVTSGIVELNGVVTDERERTALIVAAEGVAGVKAVNDHLVWVEPTSGLVIGADEAR